MGSVFSGPASIKGGHRFFCGVSPACAVLFTLLSVEESLCELEEIKGFLTAALRKHETAICNLRYTNYIADDEPTEGERQERGDGSKNNPTAPDPSDSAEKLGNLVTEQKTTSKMLIWRSKFDTKSDDYFCPDPEGTEEVRGASSAATSTAYVFDYDEPVAPLSVTMDRRQRLMWQRFSRSVS